MFYLIWILAALIVSLVTTVLQIEPALWVINLIVNNDNTFYIFLAFGITFLMLVSPIILIAFVVILYYLFKNKIPENTNKTGISIFRKRRLMDGLYVFDVYINNELKTKIVNGQNIFIDAKSGIYRVIIKSGKRTSNELKVEVNIGKVNKIILDINPKVKKAFFPQQVGFSNIYQLTESN